jgi:predicted amidophosphoribosyltransferase
MEGRIAHARALGRGARARAADLAAFVWPQRCPACGDPAPAAGLLCAPCLRAIPSVPYSLCARCLLRGAEPAGCGAHRAYAVHAAWLFDEPARAFVHALKFGGRPRLAAAAAGALADAAPPGAFDLVIAVPLHPLRRRLRGYNQAGELADAVSGSLGVPRARGLIDRTRRTSPQARLPGLRRRRLAGVFKVRDPRLLRGRRVLVVDDVMTTGATMDAVLGALAGAGALTRGLVLAWAQ